MTRSPPDLWDRILDRELMISGFCHDANGPLTAFDGYAELEGVEEGSTLRLATTRLVELLSALPLVLPAKNEADLADAFDLPPTPVLVALGFAPLLHALNALPPGRATVDLDGATAWLNLPDMPTAELRSEWNVQVVRQWLATPGGVGHAGGRVRMAARLAGAQAASFVAPEHMARGVLRIAFVRAPA